jgi:transcriptional regulator with XRE-family HTH domain
VNTLDVKEFGLYLKSKRKSKSLSTHKLAELSGVSQSYISHLEGGRKDNAPKPSILEKLAEPLGLSYVELMVAAGYWNDEDLLEPLNADSVQEFKSKLENEELQQMINKKGITYKGQAITDHDKRLIFAYLDTLFANRGEV